MPALVVFLFEDDVVLSAMHIMEDAVHPLCMAVVQVDVGCGELPVHTCGVVVDITLIAVLSEENNASRQGDF
ncbi:hypothetical protein FUT69_01885 [Xylella taiwanensis]|uniref:Secreted protein n=1 Tax=Xylella taiwanensis TaxID=1444770 RepID=A0ABS8TTQ2_9GAMM|nr:hypothetical protein [Xylella taiwanensis]MCD8461485.1 hypothetical protein [Xylella taiwanensis]MCD8466272.1 hypothetical protein [Xylella taiwanensis]MCD8468406.1 hypothetical protein [Xylella taiwanensis]MCD8472474.1 hypothetical protein [Xylella taiwanensis]NBI35992.1 hypothetical protein [Xylella taiwanensis]